MSGSVSSVVSNSQQAVAALQQTQVAQQAGIQAQELSRPEAPTAPFISPYIAFDVNFDTAVLQIRDSSTGDVLRQIPTQRSLELRQIVQRRQNAPDPVEVQAQAAPTASAEPANTAPTQQANNVSFEASVVAAQAASPESPTSTAGTTQVAIAALSAGAQSGQGSSSAVNVTA